jgi:hypothetical protein
MVGEQRQENENLHLIRQLRDELRDRFRTSLDLHDAGLKLDLESRQASEQRMQKHLLQMCSPHRDQFVTSSEVKQLHLVDAYVTLAESGNGYALYMPARGLLELLALLNEVSSRLSVAVERPMNDWRGAGEQFFAEIVRARNGTTNKTLHDVLRSDGISKRALKPLNVTECMRRLSDNPEAREPEDRYALLCDTVHHNLGSSGAVTVGSGPSDVASLRDGTPVVAPGGTIIRYQYPVPTKAQGAIDATSSDFLADARLCLGILHNLPQGPYPNDFLREPADSETGSTLLTPDAIAATQPLRRQSVGRNELCPCGSGKKFKRCCAAASHN